MATTQRRPRARRHRDAGPFLAGCVGFVYTSSHSLTSVTICRDAASYPATYARAVAGCGAGKIVATCWFRDDQSEAEMRSRFTDDVLAGSHPYSNHNVVYHD